MPRRVIVLVVVALCALVGVRPAAAKNTDAEQAQALLATLEQSTSKDERLAAAARLAELGGRVVDQLAAFLARPHATTPDERRAVLAQINASVPDAKGRFQSPGREKATQIRADDEFDWLALLVELPPQPGLGEVIADVAALRALAASKRIDAAKVILDAGFADETMIYRDESGRQLRKMAPYSVPALIVASQPTRKDRRRNTARIRYSNYQLERLDRQDPHKALDAASGDEDLQIAVLEAFGDTEHREAVRAVFDHIDDEAPRVRAAARTAWLQYIQAPHPPEPPKKKLQLTGGQLTDKEKPLWLNSLDLARYELEKRIGELFPGETVGPKIKDLETATEKLFAHHDAERAARDAAVFAEGKAKADGGDLAAAIAVFDRLLAQDPQRAERAAMAPTYLAYAEELAAAGSWSEAAAMYSKAHGLDPEGERANHALAAHYYALGKAQEAAGLDGGAAYRRAVELEPDFAEAKSAAAKASGAEPRKRWMLYLAGGVAAGAVLLLALGLVRRRTWPAR